MRADRQTNKQTDLHTYTLTTILYTRAGDDVKIL